MNIDLWSSAHQSSNELCALIEHGQNTQCSSIDRSWAEYLRSMFNALIDQWAEEKGNFGYESALLEVLPFVIARMNKLNAHF